MPVYWQFLGRREGNFRLGETLGRVSKEDIMQEVGKSKKGDNFPDKFFMPRCDFTNNIVSEDDKFDKWNDKFLMSQALADGIILKNPYHAGLLFNADCLIIGVYDLSAKRLAVLHGGLKCLVRGGYEKNIIEMLFSKHDFNPQSVFVNIGWGIGECCYGKYVNPSEKYFDEKFCDRRATKGPREGQSSVDLRKIALQTLINLGVAESSIEVDKLCTGCSGRKDRFGAGNYHSHVWDGPNAGRNAMVMWYSDAGLQ